VEGGLWVPGTASVPPTPPQPWGCGGQHPPRHGPSPRTHQGWGSTTLGGVWLGQKVDTGAELPHYGGVLTPGPHPGGVTTRERHPVGAL